MVKFSDKNVLIHNNLNLINDLICIMRVSYSKKEKKKKNAKSLWSGKIKNARYFFIFLCFLTFV